ncbi:ComF family protein [bacterium]|nr:MAG: ComF family protein [bacterium]
MRPLLDALFPSRCGLCDRLGDEAICSECRSEFVFPSDPELRFANEDLAYRIAYARYEGRAGQAVRRLKYERATSMAKPMAEESERIAGGLSFEVAVPVPIHFSRRAERGFNQAELLSECLRNVESDWLRRVKRTRPQVRMTPETRRTNLAGAFRADPRVSGKHVLLIDDVFTSGATARECAAALRVAGAREVGIVTFAVG